MIEFQDLHKAFGPKHVLQGFTLTVNEGETMVIIGYSGTGKSVAIKHVVGLLDPDQGQVVVDGQVVHELKRDALTELRSSIGFVFQFAALFDSMTIYENVAFGLRRRRDLDEDEIRSRVANALELVELPGTEERMPAELSGGMRKRVGLARAIAIQPKYMLYDEPTTGLDPVTSAVIDRLMVRTREALGVTGIVITHDMRSAYTVGDRIAMLYEGRVRTVGTVEEIRNSSDPVVRGFVEGNPDMKAAAAPLSAQQELEVEGSVRLKRANEVLVGGAVIIAAAILVVGSIWLSQLRLGHNDQLAEARFRTIGGLQRGNPVLLRGVRIGRVEAVTLGASNWVNVAFRIQGDVRIPAHPAAIISSTTLFGDWAVDLAAREDSLDPEVRRQLNEAAAAGTDRWPGATLPDIGELTAQAGRIASDIAHIAGRVEDAFDSTSVTRLKSAFSDLSNLSRRMSQIVSHQQQSLTSISTNLDTGTASLARSAASLERTLSRADSATSRDQLQRILSHTDTVTSELRSVAANLRVVSGAAAEQQQSIGRIIQNTDSVLARIESGQGTLGRLSRDTTLYSESVQAVRSLREMLQDMQRNPRKYFSFSVF